MAINPAKSQIVPDNTTNTSITDNCQSVCNINGGTLAGKNLFHSFSEFNVGVGESVYFADPGVSNIFSRITGNNASEIFGTLGISGGDANLWLLNPNGVIFGAGATLDINGSFLATTADEIQFGNDGSFSALSNSQENLALLRVDPTALFFNQMGQNHPIIVDEATLSVPKQKSITLLGGQVTQDIPGISLDFGKIAILQGNINIAALKGKGQIGIDRNHRLSFSDDAIEGDIALNRGSEISVNAAEGGNIFLTGDNITLTGRSNIFTNTIGHIDGGIIDISANNLTLDSNSAIFTYTYGTGKSSDININVKESVNLIAKDNGAWQKILTRSVSENPFFDLNTSINTITEGTGASGQISIRSKNLNLDNNAWILANTGSKGNAGNINIRIDDDIKINKSAILSISDFYTTGNTGNININSNNFLLENNSMVSSSTTGEGRGGNINLQVADSIQLRQSLLNEFFPTGIFTNTIFGSGAAGNLTVNTSKLIIQGGAGLSSASGTFGNPDFIPIGGEGGDITINATDSIFIQGISRDRRFPSGIINSTFNNSPAGNIEIHTGKLNLQDEAIISASSIGTGNAGSLTIKADESIYLSGTGFEDLQDLFLKGINGNVETQNLTGGLLSNTNQGKAGNTRITSPSLILENGALISTSTFGDAIGGNINILSQNVEVSSSLLASSSIGNGSAGNITIKTDKLATANSGLITTSSIGLGDAGNLKIDAAKSIDLIDVNNTNLTFGGLATNSLGSSYPGNMEINTGELTIRGGAKISASNRSQTQLIPDNESINNLSIEKFKLQPSKNIIINAESIDISGTSDHQFFTSGINSATYSPFPASNVEINTSNLTISNQGAIEVSSFAEGKAGNLKINADSISLHSKGALNASTISGQGGNVELQVQDILSLNNSQIQTDAFNFGNGGNINIDTTFVIATRGSNISANALSGQGGNININATDLFISADSKITASSELGGIDGEISIKTFNTNNRNNLAKLPETIIQADTSIVKSCGGNNKKKGSFSYVGKGGVSPSLLTEYHMGDRALIPDFSSDNELLENKRLNLDKTEINSLPKAKVEASTWKINHLGKVELVAEIKQNAIAKMFNNSRCPWSSQK